MIYLYGAGGHAKVIWDICASKNVPITGIFDDEPAKTIFQMQAALFPGLFDNNFDKLIIAIGNNMTREKIVLSLLKYQICYACAFHARAVVSQYAQLGHGSVIMAGAVVGVDTKVGQHCIINTNAVVEHDCMLDDFVHIGPNAALSGGVSVGKGSHIGIGACVIEGIVIGKNSIIGAGAVVIRNVADNTKVVGNPAKVLL